MVIDAEPKFEFAMYTHTHAKNPWFHTSFPLFFPRQHHRSSLRFSSFNFPPLSSILFSFHNLFHPWNPYRFVEKLSSSLSLFFSRCQSSIKLFDTKIIHNGWKFEFILKVTFKTFHTNSFVNLWLYLYEAPKGIHAYDFSLIESIMTQIRFLH